MTSDQGSLRFENPSDASFIYNLNEASGQNLSYLTSKLSIILFH